jgi:hypothetical protein
MARLQAGGEGRHSSGLLRFLVFVPRWGQVAGTVWQPPPPRSPPSTRPPPSAFLPGPARSTGHSCGVCTRRGGGCRLRPVVLSHRCGETRKEGCRLWGLPPLATVSSEGSGRRRRRVHGASTLNKSTYDDTLASKHGLDPSLRRG